MWRRGRTRLARLFRICQTIIVLIETGFITVGEAASQRQPTRFWNLTRNKILELYLAPAGTSNWGPNQCKNDPDGAVDTDERLPVTGISSGIYDAKLMDRSRQICIVRGIKIEVGAIFSIEEKDLTNILRALTVQANGALDLSVA